VISPEYHTTDSGGGTEHHSGETGRSVDEALQAFVLPPPFVEEDDTNSANSRGVFFLGPSIIFLKPIRLSGPIVNGQGAKDGNGDDNAVRAEAAQEFDLSYVPLVKGFSKIGGLRVILIEDKLTHENQTLSNEAVGGPFNGGQNRMSGARRSTEVRILKEWSVMGEIWVKTYAELIAI